MSTADLDAAQPGRKRIRNDEPGPHCTAEVIEIHDVEPQSGSSGPPGASTSNSGDSRNRQATESPDIIVPGDVIAEETGRGSRSRRSERLVCVELNEANRSKFASSLPEKAKDKKVAYTCAVCNAVSGTHIWLLGEKQSNAKAAEREKIKTELDRYLKVFSPVADLIGEFANYHPFQGTQIFNKLCALEKRLTDASQAESPTKEPSAAVLRAFQRRKEHMDLKFWNAVSYLNPGIAAFKQNSVPPAKREQFVMEITSLLRAEIHQGQDQDAEFNAKCREYFDLLKVKNRTSVDIQTFWASFPDSVLKVEALAALSVPPIVTLCDSAFSIESSLFTVQQARMSTDVAKAYLTARINGPDFTFGKKSAE